jgi:hypothetical protein
MMTVPAKEHDFPPERMTMRMLPCDVFGMVMPTACAMRDAVTLTPRFTLTVLMTTAGTALAVLDVVVTAPTNSGGERVFTTSDVVVVVAGRVVVVVGITLSVPTVTALVSAVLPEFDPT